MLAGLQVETQSLRELHTQPARVAVDKEKLVGRVAHPPPRRIQPFWCRILCNQPINIRPDVEKKKLRFPYPMTSKIAVPLRCYNSSKRGATSTVSTR